MGCLLIPKFQVHSETENVLLPVITNTHVTQMPMVITQCNIEHLNIKVIAFSCYVHITVQRSICVRQEQSYKFVIAPCSEKCHGYNDFTVNVTV